MKADESSFFLTGLGGKDDNASIESYESEPKLVQKKTKSFPRAFQSQALKNALTRIGNSRSVDRLGYSSEIGKKRYETETSSDLYGLNQGRTRNEKILNSQGRIASQREYNLA